MTLRGAEPVEGQHRFLHRHRRLDGQVATVAARQQQTLRPQFGDAGTEHDPRGGLGQRHRGGLGDERCRAAGPGVGFQHVEHVVFQGVLHVEQAAHADPAGVLIAALKGAQKPAIASVTGTEQDPQRWSLQAAALRAAGVHVAPSNAHAAVLAASVVS